MLSPSPRTYFFSRVPTWNYDCGLTAPSQVPRTMADHVVCKPSGAPVLGQSSQHPVHSTSPRLALQPTVYAIGLPMYVYIYIYTCLYPSIHVSTYLSVYVSLSTYAYRHFVGGPLWVAYLSLLHYGLCNFSFSTLSVYLYTDLVWEYPESDLSTYSHVCVLFLL